MEQTRHYTSNIQKGGALIQECRSLLLEWSPDESLSQFADRVTTENLLGKISRRRVRDIIHRIFKRRFNGTRTPGAAPIRRLVEAGIATEVANKILYYHAALTEDLLYDFVTNYLYQRHAEGGYRITVRETEEFLLSIERAGGLDQSWTPTIRTKVARGLLAACRDFNLLEGTIRKTFAPVSLPMEAFIYVAYHLKERVAAATRIVEHTDWRLFLLDPASVERMFLIAHQEGWVKYDAAGRVIRIDWRFANLMEAVDAIAQRSHSHA